jgi:5-methylcytosine-specific restriction protein A
MPITGGQGNPDWTVDETILALDVVLRNWPKIPGKDSPDILKLSEVLRRLPIHPAEVRNERFRNPHGVSLKVQNLVSLHPDMSHRKGLRSSITDRAVFEKYWSQPELVRSLAKQIAAAGAELEKIETDAGVNGTDDDYVAAEGQLLTRLHRVRERSAKFRRKVIRRVVAAKRRPTCEACGCTCAFDGIGADAIFEVHHLVPFTEVALRETRLRDLVLLCANCHKLIHAIMRCEARHCTLQGLCDRLGLSKS